jgi:hypothetical protein
VDAFPIQNGLKQGDALSSFFNFALECVIRNENEEQMELYGTHQLLVYSHVNILGQNITIKKNMETLLQDSMEIGLEVNTEKTKYMIISHHQNGGQNNNFCC